MMVIRGTTPSTGNAPGFAPNTVYILPAENCIWTQSDAPDGGYSISGVSYIHTNGAAESLTSATLGYIGKTGRFVAISV